MSLLSALKITYVAVKRIATAATSHVKSGTSERGATVANVAAKQDPPAYDTSDQTTKVPYVRVTRKAKALKATFTYSEDTFIDYPLIDSTLVSTNNTAGGPFKFYEFSTKSLRELPAEDPRTWATPRMALALDALRTALLRIDSRAKLTLTYIFRTYKEQARLRKAYVNGTGSGASLPGTSFHSAGLAADFNRQPLRVLGGSDHTKDDYWLYQFWRIASTYGLVWGRGDGTLAGAISSRKATTSESEEWHIQHDGSVRAIRRRDYTAAGATATYGLLRSNEDVDASTIYVPDTVIPEIIGVPAEGILQAQTPADTMVLGPPQTINACINRTDSITTQSRVELVQQRLQELDTANAFTTELLYRQEGLAGDTAEAVSSKSAISVESASSSLYDFDTGLWLDGKRT